MNNVLHETGNDMEFERQNTYTTGNNNSMNTTVRNAEDGNLALDYRFTVERKMEFNSTRKRMSILVRDPRDNRYKLYIKGADQEI